MGEADVALRRHILRNARFMTKRPVPTRILPEEVITLGMLCTCLGLFLVVVCLCLWSGLHLPLWAPSRPSLDPPPSGPSLDPLSGPPLDLL